MACAPGHWLARALWLALFATLRAKAMLERQWLRDRHPQYAQYCLRCKRLILWLV